MIDICVSDQRKNKKDGFHPREIYPYKTQLYVLLQNGKETGEYLFSYGGQVMLFYMGDNGMRLGYLTKDDLFAYLSHMSVKPIEGEINIDIIF